MDDIQKKLVAMANEQPSCLKDQKQLRAVLMDYIPQNRLQQNLILNAYDDDVIAKLSSATDSALIALKMIKALKSNYGLTTDLAFWSIESWCQILGMDETAQAIAIVRPSCADVRDNSQPTQQAASYRASFNLFGTYKAGIDFPAGELLLRLDGTMKEGYIAIDIGKSPSKMKRLCEFKDQTYACLKDGEYIYLRSYNNFNWKLDFSTYTITKVGD